MIVTNLTAVIAPKLFGLFVIGLIVYFAFRSKKKMDEVKERQRQREADFFAANADALIAESLRKKAEREHTGDAGMGISEQSDTFDETSAANMERASIPFGKKNYGEHNIVVLDGYVLNPGDLSYDEFKQFGTVTVYDRTPKDLVVSRMKDADLVITNKVVISRDIMMECPKLKYIGVIATGYNVVDVAAAKELGIVVTNVPGYGTDAVAQFTFALMLEMCNHVGLHSDDVMKGGWIKQTDFSYSLAPMMDLSGKTLGIIGLGSIGTRVAEIAQAFGMEVLAYTRTKTLKTALSGVRVCELDEVLSNADILSLHCPLNEGTDHIMNASNIAKMKQGAMLVNTARGGLVDEVALKNALESGKLAGAALDVISMEPMAENSILPGTKNLIVTPHIAWASHEARERLMEIALNNVELFLDGAPQNVVS